MFWLIYLHFDRGNAYRENNSNSQANTEKGQVVVVVEVREVGSHENYIDRLARLIIN